MYQFSAAYIRCVRCQGKLELEVFEQQDQQIIEGMFSCTRCNLLFPIVMGIPILYEDAPGYIANRKKHGLTMMYQKTHNQRLRSFIKDALYGSKKMSLSNAKYNKSATTSIDQSEHEEHWADVYMRSQDTEFYSVIRKHIGRCVRGGVAVEYGCSVGLVTSDIARYCNVVFGVDKSFFAVVMAKKHSDGNSNEDTRLDYFVCDSMHNPFGGQRFDTIVALNLLEIVEPIPFLDMVNKQLVGVSATAAAATTTTIATPKPQTKSTQKGLLILADPYDNKRGIQSVKLPINAETLRAELVKRKFSLIANTKTPSFVPWKLKINPRTSIHYLADIVIGEK